MTQQELEAADTESYWKPWLMANGSLIQPTRDFLETSVFRFRCHQVSTLSWVLNTFLPLLEYNNRQRCLELLCWMKHENPLQLSVLPLSELSFAYRMLKQHDVFDLWPADVPRDESFDVGVDMEEIGYIENELELLLDHYKLSAVCFGSNTTARE